MVGGVVGWGVVVGVLCWLGIGVEDFVLGGMLGVVVVIVGFLGFLWRLFLGVMVRGVLLGWVGVFFWSFFVFGGVCSWSCLCSKYLHGITDTVVIYRADAAVG